ncbi:GntR family transcriptional regulator [Pseudonocardia sp. TRM90224]|uniref:GntR family transcriptional regulator n=1 Tax=Pseudonocardia sp. TRM90224 TaxID=2812678 RepID=UPI001E34900D|nr:GntR family transcriptional regulator [Pseudonocardia sp. TRM90224]
MHETARVRPPTVQEFVLIELRKALGTGELKPGQPIRQEVIAERLGVSRLPLREALKILEGEGRVIHQPHRGYHVPELSAAELHDIFWIRGILETQAARLAAERLTDADIEQIVVARSVAATASTQGDAQAMTTANREFHFAVFDGCRVDRLVNIIRNLWNATDAYRWVYYESKGNRERVAQEHREIVDALQRRDADRLVSALDAHRTHAVESLSAFIGTADI